MQFLFVIYGNQLVVNSVHIKAIKLKSHKSQYELPIN